MLDREIIKNGMDFSFNGQDVTVFMIHKVGRGESLTLHKKMPPDCDNPYPFLIGGTVRMMDFRKEATQIKN